MANNVAAQLSVENTALFWCKVITKSVNATTGEIEEAPHTGQTVRLMIADTKLLSSAAKIGALEIASLTEIAGLGIYWGTLTGTVLSTNLLPTYEGVPVFVHFVIDNDDEWHEVAQTIPRDERESA